MSMDKTTTRHDFEHDAAGRRRAVKHCARCGARNSFTAHLVPCNVTQAEIDAIGGLFVAAVLAGGAA